MAKARKLYEAFGENRSAREWSRLTGINLDALYQGAHRQGSLETYLRARGMRSLDPSTLLPRGVRSEDQLVPAFGHRRTLTSWARLNGTVPGALYEGITVHGSLENYFRHHWTKRGLCPRCTLGDDTFTCMGYGKECRRARAPKN